MKLTLEDFLGILFILGVLMPCYASVLIGAFVLLADCVHWLNTAVWYPTTIHDGLVILFGGPFEHLHSGHLGWDKIVNWALDSSLALWMILIGPFVWLIGWTLTLDKIWPKGNGAKQHR
jgi:hypothetical protein